MSTHQELTWSCGWHTVSGLVRISPNLLILQWCSSHHPMMPFLSRRKPYWCSSLTSINQGSVSLAQQSATGLKENCCSVTKLCQTLCNCMDCSIPGFSVLHYLLEFTQIHIHWVSDTIQPSHPLSPPSPPALTLSQHQGLFQWVSALPQVAKGLELQLQHQSFPVNMQGWFPLELTGLISLQSKGLSRVISSTTVQRHQFFSAQPSLWSNSHTCTWLLGKPQLWLYGPLLANWCLCFLISWLGLSAFLLSLFHSQWRKVRWDNEKSFLALPSSSLPSKLAGA